MLLAKVFQVSGIVESPGVVVVLSIQMVHLSWDQKVKGHTEELDI